jgi:hypothetical protein
VLSSVPEVSDEDGSALVLDEVSDGVAVVDDESDALGVSVGDVVSLGEVLSVGLGESSSVAEESLEDATALVLRVVAVLPPPAAALFAEVRTVDVVGGDPQSELESAVDACAEKELTSSTTTPKNASPIAAPSAAGLRSSSLTVHPRYKEPVGSGRARHSRSPHYLWIARLPYSSCVSNQIFMIA